MMQQAKLPDQAVSLVILAAGMGSRFGGDKQLATIGQTNRTLLHFSVLDAYQAGVRHLVLVIRAELRQLFKNQVLPYFPADLQVELVEQHISLLPAQCHIDCSQRQKPWGTAHAVWVARTALKQQPFIVMNADDYYGSMAMCQLVQHFQNSNDWAMVAYPLTVTLSRFGGVNRGICQVADGMLQQVAEWLDIRQLSSGVILGHCGEQQAQLPAAAPVSMNIWGFGPDLLPLLEQQLTLFLQQAPRQQQECFLPAVVDQALNRGQKLHVYAATQPWFGVTYPDDLLQINQYFQQTPTDFQS